MRRRYLFGVLCLVSGCLAAGESAHANSKWQVDAELRLRYEWLDGFNDKGYGGNLGVGDSHDGFLLSRARLGLTGQLAPNVRLRVSVQDARALDWGFNNDDWYNTEFGMENNPQSDYLELHHTYLEVSGIADLPLTLTLGRQRIAYGDCRVFGPGEWKNSGKWVWDAARLSYAHGDHFLDVFYGKTMLHEPNEFSLSHRWGYEAAGLYGHYAWDKGAVEPILAYKHNRNGNDKYRRLSHYYAGLRVYDDDVAGFFYNGTLMGQWGYREALSGDEADVNAYGWHIDAGRTFKTGQSKAKVGLGYTYASGDDADTSDAEQFDAVFGASDRYYGRMNLMSWSNLRDAEAFVVVKPIQKLRIKVEYHRFWVADTSAKWRNYQNAAGSHEDHLGDEVDIVAKYGLSKAVDFMAGYSHFWPGDFIHENVPGEGQADWFFFQAILSY